MTGTLVCLAAVVLGALDAEGIAVRGQCPPSGAYGQGGAVAVFHLVSEVGVRRARHLAHFAIVAGALVLIGLAIAGYFLLAPDQTTVPPAV